MARLPSAIGSVRPGHCWSRQSSVPLGAYGPCSAMAHRDRPAEVVSRSVCWQRRPPVPTAAHGPLVAPKVLRSGLGPVPKAYCTVVTEPDRCQSLRVDRMVTSVDCHLSCRVFETGASLQRRDELRPPSIHAHSSVLNIYSAGVASPTTSATASAAARRPP